MRVSFQRRSRVKSFVMVQNVLSVIVMILFGVLFGLAMMPSYFLFLEIGEITNGEGDLVEAAGVCISLGLGYILWGVVLLLICGTMGGVFRIRKEEGRYPLRSFITIQWAFSLVSHRVAQMFLGLVIPSFLATMYYRMMGNTGIQVSVLSYGFWATYGIKDRLSGEEGVKTAKDLMSIVRNAGVN